ncbi:MAG TPA: cytochrome c3 family protein, partial [Vicinamibacteria bacterium]|nr:cytochrome c3 family protein [Vicinamibacteria bacterium]
GDCAACHVAPARSGAPTPAALSKNANELCSGCHSDFASSSLKGSWVHAPAKAGQCVACHSPHASREKHLVARSGSDLCLQCHPAVKTELAKPQIHEPVAKGQCAACHAPHSADNKAGLRKTGAELCFGCHKEKKALASLASVHAPFASGDCDSCHTPHTSSFKGQLVADPKKLCLTCHDVNEPRLVQRHHRFPLAGVDCTQCHNPHASSEAKLIRPRPHAILTSCGKCHDVNGRKPTALLAGVEELCARCHAPVKQAAARPDAHPAMQKGCLTCHTPHAAEVKGLLKGDGQSACLACHDGVRRTLAGAFSTHPLRADKGGCAGCHTGHASDQKPLLKAAPLELCRSCHEQHSSFSHPFGAGVIDPRTGQDMTCLSCHRPHASAQPHVLVANAQRELCVQCHASEGPTLKAGHGEVKPAERPN